MYIFISVGVNGKRNPMAFIMRTFYINTKLIKENEIQPKL